MRQFSCSALATPADFFAFDCTCDLAAANTVDVARVTELIDVASDMLCILSNYQMFGRCTRTLAPFGNTEVCGVWEPAAYYTPRYDPLAGALDLPQPLPVVDSVTIAGSTLADSNYTVVNGKLVRTDGGVWPMNNTLVEDDTGWRLVVTYGWFPDTLVTDAICELVCELDKPISQRRSNLKMGVKSVNLQGVNATLEDDADALREGHENLDAVARFLGVWNPDNLRSPSGIISVDQPWTFYDVTPATP